MTQTRVAVYRSEKKADTYIYLRSGFRWEELPDDLRTVFGPPSHVMDLALTPERKLARTNGEQVLTAIAEKDYYLQMPEEQGSGIVAFNQKLASPDS